MKKVVGRLWQPSVETGVKNVVEEADDLLLLIGVNKANLELLTKNGYLTYTIIADLRVEELTSIKGFGKKSAETIINSAKEKVAAWG